MANLSVLCVATRPVLVWWLSQVRLWVVTCSALTPRSGSYMLSLTHHQLRQAGGQEEEEELRSPRERRARRRMEETGKERTKIVFPLHVGLVYHFCTNK